MVWYESARLSHGRLVRDWDIHVVRDGDGDGDGDPYGEHIDLCTRHLQTFLCWRTPLCIHACLISFLAESNLEKIGICSILTKLLLPF